MMRVIRVKSKRERERLERLLLRKKKVLAVIDNPKYIGDEFTRKADFVIIEEKKS
jgi:hypothetical protein